MCIYYIICIYIFLIYIFLLYIYIYIYIYMYIYFTFIYYINIYISYIHISIIYIYVYIYIRGKHPWTSDPFKKALILKVTLPYGCFSRHFIYFFFFILLYSVIINNAKPTCVFFKITWLVSNRAKYHMLDNWSKQCTLEVSVIATDLVPSTILFPAKKLWLLNENVNTFHRYLLKALLCILFKFDQVSFLVVVWPVWLMLHNFVPAFACLIIFVSLPLDRRR